MMNLATRSEQSKMTALEGIGKFFPQIYSAKSSEDVNNAVLCFKDSNFVMQARRKASSLPWEKQWSISREEFQLCNDFNEKVNIS